MLLVTTYHHGDLPAALLRAALKLLEKEGVAGLSVRAAARRAKVSHNAPYRHFPDRESLLAGIAGEGFRQLGEALGTSAGKGMGEAYVHFALEHPQLFRLMFGGALPAEVHPALREAADRSFQAVVDRFRTHADGEHALVAAAAAWSLVHGLSHLLLDGQFEASPGFVRRVLDAVRYDLGSQRTA